MGKLLCALMSATVIMKSCTITLGGGGGSGGNGGTVALGVPFISQENDHFCGPTSIEMWALFDGVTGLTQTGIANAIGTTQAGSSAQQIRYGVSLFTRSGRDAGLDYAGGTTDQIGIYYSKEVTSANNFVPFAVLINGALHVGVVTGGTWHVDSDTNLNIWDSVDFQDPIVGPHQPYVAGEWTNADIGHIISSSASFGADSNYNQYGGSVRVRGSAGGGGGGWQY
ncbi:MAG TPA: C39 family peptidase [Thermoanaerobaculia bacterium]|nr:C39 family peptidase [Thermoanaerobaculia bacterium]